MSAEYESRMEILQRKREELTAQRQAIEKRMALREATAAEFSAVAVQSLQQKWKTQRSSAIAAKKHNDCFVRELHELQKQMHDRLQNDHSSSSALLAQEKSRYNHRVEQIYPAWQEQQQLQRVQKLKELEDKKRAVKRRRYLAKKSFEKEQKMDDLIRKTRHEVKLAETLEHNEHYERELLRTQSTNQAIEVDQNIRKVAVEARSILQQHAARHSEVAPEVAEELTEKLSEALSPRNTLRALREGSSLLAFDDIHLDDDINFARQITIELPARKSATVEANCVDVEEKRPEQGPKYEEYFEDDLDESACNFDERTAYSNLVTTDEYNLAKTDYANPKEVNNSHEANADYNHTTWVAAYSAGHADSLIDGFSECLNTSQQGSISHDDLTISTKCDEDVSQPCELSKIIPTLGTGTLFSIPEANEPLSTSRVGILRKDDVSNHDTCRSDIAKSFELTTLTHVNLQSCVHKSHMIVSPDNSLERRGTNSSAMLSTSTISTKDNTAEIHEFSERRADIKSFEYSAKCTERHGGTPDNLNELPLSISNGGSGNGAQVLKPLFSVDENDYIMKGSSGSRQVDFDASNSTGMLAIAVTKDRLETRETSIESDKGIVAASNSSISDHVFGLGSHSNEANPIHDTSSAFVTTTESISTTARTSPDTDKTLVAMKDSYTEKALEDALPGVTDVLEPFLPTPLTPVTAQRTEDEIMLASMQSDDFDLLGDCTKVNLTISSSIDQPVGDNTEAVMSSMKCHDSFPESPSTTKQEQYTYATISEKLTPADRMKVLEALIRRVEEGATEGDTLDGPRDTGSSYESKRELMRMAVGGRRAQIAFFGSDVCFEVILDISRDLGPVLFPPKSFEGIMTDQKICKLHQGNKDKQLDLWKALSSHFKHLVELKAIPTAILVDLALAAFLAHDSGNERSQRKLREYLVTVCGGGGDMALSPRKETSASSKLPWQKQHTPGPEHLVSGELTDKDGIPQLQPTAISQRQSPSIGKVFEIASSSLIDNSRTSSDVLTSMSTGPMKLSQKLMRGGKINDYSEFEEEEEVDLQNLIGTKPMVGNKLPAGSDSQGVAKTAQNGRLMEKLAAVQGDDDGFDADF